jgi:SARP family transcriptional regulator, regulator of embCAB operon
VDEQLPGRQGRLLFAYLVDAQGRAVARDELAEVLWEGDLPTTWESALRVLVSKVRRVLADQADLEAAASGYRLKLSATTWVDVVAAGRATQEAEDRLAAGELDAAIAAGTLAESLLRATFMPGDDGSWVQTRRRELEGVRARAVNTLAGGSLGSGKAEASVRWAREAVEIEPFRESGYRSLMAAHAAAGNRAEALRVYDHCRRLLAEELGAFPSPETEAVYRELLVQPSAPAEIAAAPAPTAHSWRGSRNGKIVLAGAALVVAAAVAGVLAFAGGNGSGPVILRNSVARIDPKTLKVTEVASVGDAPDLIVASGGYLWVTNHILRGPGLNANDAVRNAGDHTLVRVDPATGETVVVGGGLSPCGMTPDPSGDVWIANCYPALPGLRDDVVRVDARTLAFRRTWAAPSGNSYFRGMAYGGGWLWLAPIADSGTAGADRVTRVDPETGAEQTIPLKHPASALAWSGAYGELWISSFDDGSLTRLEPGTGATRTTLGVAGHPVSPVVGGGAVWVTDWIGDQVVRLNAVGAPRIRRISLPGVTGGVWSIAVGADAVWAATPSDKAVWRVDLKTSRVTRVPLPYSPAGVAVDTNDVWVTVRQ